MKIPFKWLKDYVNTNKSAQETAESFTLLGLLLDKPITNDVLDLEHRFDRSDWLSIYGCARDLTAFEKIPLKNLELHTQKGRISSKENIINIIVECPNLVNRFNTRVFRNIKVKNSPEWLKTRLEDYGIPTINNIVDITNFVMVELGQPMHAQDLAKLENPKIVIRNAREKEQFTTFLGEKLTLDTDMFVLTQGKEATVLGGIVGSKSTGIGDTTTDIILDAGNYNQTNVRQTSRKLKMQNETVTRYDKFLHPKLTEVALQRATKLILELAGGDYYENIDYYPNKIPEKAMILRVKRLLEISGMEIKTEEVVNILKSLGYEILNNENNEFKLKIPYFRTDIEVEDDIVSDILRINNYEKIPLKFLNTAPPKEITPPFYDFEDNLRNILVSLGLHEHITDPMTSRDENNENQVIIENSLNPEKNALRHLIFKTLFPVTGTYEKADFSEIGIFEIGKIYEKTNKGEDLEDYIESRVVEVIYANFKENREYISKKVKSLLSGVLLNLGIKNLTYIKYKDYAQIKHGNETVGYLKYNTFQLFIQKLLKITASDIRVMGDYREKQYLDISVELDLDFAGGEVISLLKSNENVLDVIVLDEFKTETLRSVTFRIFVKEKNQQEIGKLKTIIIRKNLKIRD